MSMRYITKVDDVHVVEINGVNHQVPERVVQYSSIDEPQIIFNGCRIASDNTVDLESHGYHLAQIVLAVEVAKFIRENVKE